MPPASGEDRFTVRARVRPAQRSAFGLIELLIVVSIVGIFAALLLPKWGVNSAEQLRQAGQLVVADLAYARNFAVTKNSKYRYTFDLSNNWYYLEHTGSNTDLDTLPANPFSSYGDPVEKQMHRLSELFSSIGQVRLAAVYSQSNGQITNETTVEFTEIGRTTRARETVVWLQVGTGSERRYLPVYVAPVTGIASPGAVTSALPQPTVGGPSVGGGGSL